MELKNNYDYLFKIIVIGGFDLGKKSLINRFIDDAYHSKSDIFGKFQFKF